MTYDMDMDISAPSFEESRAFFRDAKIAPLSPRPRALAQLSEKSETKDSDLLIGNDTPAVVGFADNVSEENRQAVQDSIQFSERYADANADIQKAPIQWHAKYREAMKNCGWYMTSYKYAEHTTSQTNVTMDAIVLDIIKTVAGTNAPAMLGLMGSIFDAIKSDEKNVQLFEMTSNKDGMGEFRIVPCLQSPAGTPITAFLAVDCELKSNQGGAWFWKWKWSQLKMKKVATMVELNMRRHLQNQGFIDDALQKDSEAFFKNAKLS